MTQKKHLHPDFSLNFDLKTFLHKRATSYNREKCVILLPLAMLYSGLLFLTAWLKWKTLSSINISNNLIRDKQVI